MTATRGAGGEWEYYLVASAMDAAGIHPIGKYTMRRKMTIAKKVACLPIYELCVKAERILGTIRMVRWWDQDVVNESEE